MPNLKSINLSKLLDFISQYYLLAGVNLSNTSYGIKSFVGSYWGSSGFLMFLSQMFSGFAHSSISSLNCIFSLKSTNSDYLLISIIFYYAYVSSSALTESTNLKLSA